MRICPLLICLLCVIVPFTNQAKGFYTSSDSLPNTFSIRVHILPYVFGNDGGISYAIGGEYGFHKVHAIGIDLAYTDYHSGEEMQDTTTGLSKPAPRQRWVQRSILLSYRYYFSFRQGKNNSYRSYLSAFTRLGNMDYHPEEGYKYQDATLRNRVKYDEQQYSFGLLYGILSPFNIGDFNVDFNTGPFWKWKFDQDVRLENGTNVLHHEQSNNFGWRLGLNFALIYKR